MPPVIGGRSYNRPMWQFLLEEADISLEIVMGALGIPLREKELGKKAMYALGPYWKTPP